MGDTFKIEGSCDMNMMYDHFMDEFTCKTCPFNAMNDDGGCSIKYDSRVVKTLPNPYPTKQVEDDFKHLDEDYANMVKRYLGESNDIVNELLEYGKKGLSRTRAVFTLDDARKLLNLLIFWNPSDEQLEKVGMIGESYRASVLVMVTILRRAVLLEKGIIIYL